LLLIGSLTSTMASTNQGHVSPNQGMFARDSPITD